MCTVSLIPRDVGYYLAMNRDEQLKRIAGLPPERKIANGRAILYPSEPGGGTWISLNDAQVCFALINWYSVQARVKSGAVSRGEVVNTVSSCSTIVETQECLARLPMEKMNPFRLIGIFPSNREVMEWSWDLRRLRQRRHLWKAQQWISSGYHEPTAQIMRGATFQRAQQNCSTGTLEWLFQLHRSHDPERGPFSTCMHRADAATVSYTEVCVSGEAGSMGYLSGSPCMNSRRDISVLLNTPHVSPVDCSLHLALLRY